MNLAVIIASLCLTPISGLDDNGAVRISVLSLLKPQAITIRCEEETPFELLHNSAERYKLLPGEIIEAGIVDGKLSVCVRSLRDEKVCFEPAASCKLLDSGNENEIEIEVVEPTRFKRRLSGVLEISVENGLLKLVLESTLERIVGEIAAAEMGDDAPTTALEAMAVAARSYIAASRGRHAGEGFDICDTTHCLLYRGLDGPFGRNGDEALRRGIQSAKATAGTILADGSEVVPGYFHSCCGGQTATPAMIWGSEFHSNVFVPVKCSLCVDSPNSRWRRSASLSSVLCALGIESGCETANIELEHHIESHYVSSVRITGLPEDVVMNPDDFKLRIGRSLGWDVVRSNSYRLFRDGEEVVFEGVGFGHGVGLCQEGAKAAALAGWDWRRILRYYFPRCSFRSLRADQ